MDVDRISRFEPDQCRAPFVTIYTSAGPLTFGHGDEALA